MPKPTFLNLSQEKREKFLEIALEEFATHDYEIASISQIVARAQIAKGSLYQYFEDKQDLFLYLLELSNQKLLEVAQHPAQEEAPSGQKREIQAEPGFFDWLRTMMSTTVQAAGRFPLHARLVMRAYAAPLPFYSETIEQSRKMRHAFLRQRLEKAIQTGEVDPGLDPGIAVDAIGALISAIGQTVMDYLNLNIEQVVNGSPEQFDNPITETVFEQYMRLIEFGLANRVRRQDESDR